MNPIQFEEMKIYMLKKYVDDCFYSGNKMKPGTSWNWSTKTLNWSEEQQEFDLLSNEDDELRTILAHIQFTWDSPSRNTNGKRPVLYCKLWIGQEQRSKGIPATFNTNAPAFVRKGHLKQVILFQFYKKPMANKCSNLARNGLPNGQQLNTSVQECIRRLKNTSRDLQENIVKEVLTEYMEELCHGGYFIHRTTEILKYALTGYSRMWKLVPGQ